MDEKLSIRSLGLKKKLYKALTQIGVNTVEEFIKCNLDAILDVPGMGKGTVLKLRDIRCDIIDNNCRTLNLSNYTKIDDRWMNLHVNLSVRVKYIFEKLSVSSIQDVQNLNYEDFISARNAGKKCWNEVLALKEKIVRLPFECPPHEKIILEYFPLFGGHLVLDDKMILDFHPDVDVNLFITNSRCLQACNALNLTTMSDVLGTSFLELKKVKNFGKVSLIKLQDSVRNYLDFLNTEDVELDMQDSFLNFLYHLCHKCNQSSKKSDIFVLRFVGFDSVPMTLEYIGSQYDLTRERVRQLVVLISEEIKRNYLCDKFIDAFIVTIQNLIYQARGVICLQSLGEKLSEVMGWKCPVSGVSLKLFFNFFLEDQYIKIENERAYMKHECRSCEIIRKQLS